MASIALLLTITCMAALSRFLLTETESRKQIIAFWVLSACAGGVLKLTLGLRRSWPLALLTGTTATAAILLVRWHLEGLCPHTWPQCPDPIYAIRKSWGI